MRRTKTSRVTALLSLFCAFALIAAACGGSSSSDESGDGGDGGSSSGDAAVATTAPEQAEEQAEKVEEATAAGEDVREVETGPVRGGRLVYGIEADVASPWAHYGLTCSISCDMPYRAFADPIGIIGADGKFAPVLAKSWESNDDATEFVFELYEGIKFHDGSALDAQAVKYNFDVCRASAGRGRDLLAISDVIAEGNTVTFKLSETWAAFPISVLVANPCTYILSTEWMRTLETNPLRTESPFTGEDLIDQATVDTPADGDQAMPIASGPFRVASFTPGNGNGMLVERNEDYWRGDGPDSVTNEGLPYLDEVEFVIAVDIASRSASLESGQFDMIHTANADEIAKFRSDADFVTIEANQYGETSYFLINLADGELDPDGVNAGNPLLDLRVRKALAHAMDRERVALERGAGIVKVANGPFSPGQPGNLEDNGFPDFDIAAAQALMDEYVADPNRGDGKAVGEAIEFEFNTTNDAFNVETNQLVESMWNEAFGDKIDVTISPIEQGQYVSLAVQGAYQVQGWRQHGGPDHDSQLRFFTSATTAPIGTPTFGFGRIHDDEIDRLAAASRASTDNDERKAIFEDMNRVFGEQVYFLTTVYTLWGVLADPRVNDITTMPLPGGGTGFPILSGSHHLHQAWCADGDCKG